MDSLLSIVRSVLGEAPSGAEVLEYMFAGILAVFVLILLFRLLFQVLSLFSR